jgi:hypothetical protein
MALSNESPVEARCKKDPLHPSGAHQLVGEARDAAEQRGSELAWRQEQRWGKVAKEVTSGAIYRGKSPSGVISSSWVPSPTESKISSRFGVDSHLS